MRANEVDWRRPGDTQMRHPRAERLAVIAAIAMVGTRQGPATAQAPTKKAPTAAEWAALAQLPDFTGVWEISMGGGGGRGRGGPPQGPSLTPAAAAKRKELQSLGRED